MNITEKQLRYIMPMAKSRATLFLGPLNKAMALFQINTVKRAAAFLAQVAHESAELRYTEEIASGEAYEGRKDLGNIIAGDGKKFKGHGLIQITGRYNHLLLAKSLMMNLDQLLEYLKTPDGAASSAAWFWKTNGLNEIADKENFMLITKKINGGYNGQKERAAYWEKAKLILSTNETI